MPFSLDCLALLSGMVLLGLSSFSQDMVVLFDLQTAKARAGGQTDHHDARSLATA